MLYRASRPSDEGFENAQEEFDAMRDYAQNIFATSDPNDVMDTFLMLANVCEMRALLDPVHGEWWSRAGECARAVLVMLNDTHALPNAKLENPMLYFPEVKDVV
jgi:hypothetical protein